MGKLSTEQMHLTGIRNTTGSFKWISEELGEALLAVLQQIH
jgi:hypothetical protein